MNFKELSIFSTQAKKGVVAFDLIRMGKKQNNEKLSCLVRLVEVDMTEIEFAERNICVTLLV